LRRPIPKSALAAIERDRWIGYPNGDAGLFRLNELYTMRARVRMPCLLIYGVSGAGKSMLLEKFKRDHAPKRANRNGQRPSGAPTRGRQFLDISGQSRSIHRLSFSSCFCAHNKALPSSAKLPQPLWSARH
jgi:hypothetical protein